MIGVADRMLAVHDALREAGFSHAIGGAIALGYCTLEARGTQDVDINVFVPPSRTREVFAALPEGIRITGKNLEVAQRDGQVRNMWGTTTTDAELNLLYVSLGVRPSPVLDCTGLAVFKAMFARPRDWVDIEAMVEARSFNVDEAIGWIREMVGDDPRVETLTSLNTSRRSQGEPPPLRPKASDSTNEPG